MPYFYLNIGTQKNGDHEVHQKDAGCGHEPNAGNRIGSGPAPMQAGNAAGRSPGGRPAIDKIIVIFARIGS